MQIIIIAREHWINCGKYSTTLVLLLIDWNSVAIFIGNYFATGTILLGENFNGKMLHNENPNNISISMLHRIFIHSLKTHEVQIVQKKKKNIVKVILNILKGITDLFGLFKQWWTCWKQLWVILRTQNAIKTDFRKNKNTHLKPVDRITERQNDGKTEG